MDVEFVLDGILKADTILVAEWELSQVLLMNDCQYPWLILVPAKSDLVEIYDLSEQDQQLLLRESMALGRWLMDRFEGHKLNVGALGNVVRQLHVHHIVRFENDAAWPAPVWGKLPAKPYSEAALSEILEKLAPLKALF